MTFKEEYRKEKERRERIKNGEIEVERKCNHCETVWFLSIEEAHEKEKPSYWEKTARGGIYGGLVSNTRSKQAALNEFRDRQLRVRERRHCPHCRSQNFTEREICTTCEEAS